MWLYEIKGLKDLSLSVDSIHLMHILAMSASRAGVLRWILASGTFYCGIELPSSADSRRASCQLLAKECALNAGKLPPGDLSRNSG